MVDVKNLIGGSVQGWQLQEVLGQGADGIVYSATKAGERAAVKLFFPEGLALNGFEAAQERLELQLSLAGEKRHPNLVEIFNGGVDEELKTLYIVMELAPGRYLDKVLKYIPEASIAGLVKQLAAACRHLEEQKLFHRDIKPANIIISDEFDKITLLDLGIVYQVPTDEDADRLSGDEFVATLRYSPPEFVWRREESAEPDAWRAVTFYQIGATIHDILMKAPLFAGHDRPRATLYDSVRDLTPRIECNGQNAWLVPVVQACLLKDWRQRLKLLEWDLFDGPRPAADVKQWEMNLRLRQMRNEEARMAEAAKEKRAPKKSREEELWQLNSSVFLELRTFLIDSPIFPRFSASESRPHDRDFASTFTFENDASRDFASTVTVTVTFKAAPLMDEATVLTFESAHDGAALVKASWTEMFTIEGAFSYCRRSLLETVEQLIPKTEGV